MAANFQIAKRQRLTQDVFKTFNKQMEMQAHSEVR
jgi:hypothetical protein